MRSSLTRLLRVRRLMEDMSRAEFAERRAEQAELEQRRETARATAWTLRGQARTAMLSPAGDGSRAGAEDLLPGLWQRLLADSETSAAQVEGWDRAARAAERRSEEAERMYLAERRSRMQAEIVVRDRLAAERLEMERREQREIDDWFGMGRAARGAAGARRARDKNSPI